MRDHDPRAAATSSTRRNWRRLAATVAIGGVILVVEIIAGIRSNSLALLADAGHVFADVSGIGLSLVAAWLAGRPRTAERTFGWFRLEILAAIANALLLLGISIVIVYEGVRRFAEPPVLEAGPILGVAAFALGANLLSLRLLTDGRPESLNVRAAYLEVAGDVLGAGAVLVAGLVIALTSWQQADAVASIAIGLLIVPRTITLLRDGLDVLLEATPKGIDMAHVRTHVLEAPGVIDVHDLHAWTITSGMNVVSAHVVLAPDAQPGDVLDHLATCLSDDFDVGHSTFQLETPDHVRWEARASRPLH
ncbi:MAG TPA: cation diffusion facilitator family transporter [Candidatus Bathyarchaeia archaeon]|nr:cation diffusion facilitator family transporter [Candidatus Bathyarchaeia archaeon]